MNLSMEELRKLLKENRVCFYSYWGKGKLEDLARINKLIPENLEPEPEPKPEEETKTFKRPDYKRMRKIRNAPISVKIIDVETKEEKIFPSIYKAAQFIDKCPQTVAHYGRHQLVWNKKYQIVIE